MHGIGGNLGYAAAPVVVYALASAIGWRGALALAGAAGLLCRLAILDALRAALVCHVGHGRKADTSSAIALFRQPAILACFAYFAIYTIGTIGLQIKPRRRRSTSRHGIPLALATSVGTRCCSAAPRGSSPAASSPRTTRHDRAAASGLRGGADAG